MRVLIITNLFPNRVEPGRGVFNQQQFAELAKRCDLAVVAPVPWFPRAAWLRRLAPRWARSVQVPDAETIAGIPVHHPRYVVIPKIARALYGWLFFLGVRRTVQRLHQQAPCDVILATWAYPDVFGAALLARRLRRPLIAKVHGSDIHLAARGPVRRRMIAWALRQADAVVAVSEPLRDAMVRFGVEPARIVIIPNGVDRERFRSRSRRDARAALGLAPEGRRIVFVGNLAPVKGPDVLLAAMRRLPGDVRLSFVGDGPMQEYLQALAQSDGLNGRVEFAGRRPHPEIPLWLCASDVVCLPSRSEGCPNALLEALACGRPVVATAVGAVPTLLRSGECGLVVPPDRPAALAEALARSLEETWSPEQIRRAVLANGWEASAGRLAELLTAAQDGAPPCSVEDRLTGQRVARRRAPTPPAADGAGSVRRGEDGGGCAATGPAVQGPFRQGSATPAPGAAGMKRAIKSAVLRMAPKRLLLSRGDRRRRTVALSFDDGPHPGHTERILAVLREEGVKATFFLVGAEVEKYPALAKAIVSDGHAVGGHSWSHRRLTGLGRQELERELEQTAALLRQTTGVASRLVRPPYGAMSLPLLRHAAARGWTIVLWSVESGDHLPSASPAALREAARSVKPGDIVLLHEDYPHTVEALRDIIRDLKAQEFSFATIEEFVGRRPRGLQDSGAVSRRAAT